MRRSTAERPTASARKSSSERALLRCRHARSSECVRPSAYVTLAAGSPRTPIYPPAILGEDLPPFLVPIIRADRVVIHPDFGGFENRRHDLAVVLFPPGTFAGVEPVELPKLHQLDRLDLGRKPLRLVGYGLDPEHGDADSAQTRSSSARVTARPPRRRFAG